MPKSAPVLARLNTSFPTRLSVPDQVLEYLGAAALFPGETQADFNALLLEIGNAVGAKDIVDWISVNDIAHLVWEARRLRNIKVSMIDEARVTVMEQLLTATFDRTDVVDDTAYIISGARNDARRAIRDKAFAAEIEMRLGQRGYPPAVILAKSYELCATRLAGLERMISDCELRRMVAISEIGRRRDSVARRLRRAVSDYDEVQCAEAAE